MDALSTAGETGSKMNAEDAQSIDNAQQAADSLSLVRKINVPGTLQHTNTPLWLFDSAQAMEDFAMNGALGVGVKTNASYIDRDVRILSSEAVPHAQVLLTCHYFDPKGPL